MSELMDYIDLTQDSPMSCRTRRVRDQNRERQSDARRKRRTRKVPVEQLESTIIIDPADSSLKVEEANLDPVEVIDLDEHLTQENSAACVVDEMREGNLVMLVCPVCLEQLCSGRKPTSTRCGHIFCGDCLQQAVKATKKCPTCQAPVKIKSCTRLYF